MSESFPLPSSYQYGKVVARLIYAIADTAEDEDDKPQARAAAGKVLFKPASKGGKVTDADYTAIAMHSTLTATLSSTGRIIDAEGRQGIWLVTGFYQVEFDFNPTVPDGLKGTLPPFPIEVTAAHTAEHPLDLASAVPASVPTGATVTTMVVPAGGTEGQILARAPGGQMVWTDPVEPKVPSWDDLGKPAVIAAGVDAAAARAAIGAQPAGSYASAAQGTKADTAVQPDDLPTWGSIDGKPAVIAAGVDADAARTAIGALSTDAMLSVIRDQSGVIYLDSFPRQGGETDDSPRLTRALAAAGTLGAKVLQLGAKTYTLATQVTVSVANLTLRGAGQQATEIIVPNDIIALNVTAAYFRLEDLRVNCTSLARTVYPVKFTDADHGVVTGCYFRGSDGSRRAGVHFIGGSMGRVHHSTFSHACVRIETWDVRVTECFIWAMSCEFGIGIFGGIGNTRVEGLDVVPPFATNADGLAGIYVSGAAFGTRLASIYLDGNPTLNLKEGIIVRNGAAGTIISDVIANQMDADCIVLDSVYNTLVNGYSGVNNNRQGNGTREIVVRQTGAQPVEHVQLTNIQCAMTAAVTGTAGPAIEVESSVAIVDQVSITNFDIKQPSGGGGYSLPEVLVPISGGYPTQSLSGKGQRGRYSAVGSAAVASGANGLSINLGNTYPMAYRPRPSQITLAAEGAPLPAYRIQYTTDDQIYVAFASPISAAATVHWRATLLR